MDKTLELITQVKFDALKKVRKVRKNQNQTTKKKVAT